MANGDGGHLAITYGGELLYLEQFGFISVCCSSRSDQGLIQVAEIRRR